MTGKADTRRSTPDRYPCPDCPRDMPVNADGRLRKHRQDAFVFAGPYCSGSGTKVGRP